MSKSIRDMGLICMLLASCGENSALHLNVIGEHSEYANEFGIRKPIVIAHRGFSAVAPENTLPAMNLAIDAGADFVELDYHHSLDGTPVVMHDKTLDRTTNADEITQRRQLQLRNIPTEAMLQFDAGSWFSNGYQDTKIPLLAEALPLIQGRGKTTLVEHKDGDAQTCFDLLNELGYVQDVVVQSFNWNFLENLRALNSEVKLSALYGGPFTPAIKQRLENMRLNYVSFHYSSLNEEIIQQLHAMGLQVFAYVVNSPVQAERLYKIGIDGIITDRPDMIRLYKRLGTQNHALLATNHK